MENEEEQLKIAVTDSKADVDAKDDTAVNKRPIFKLMDKRTAKKATVKMTFTAMFTALVMVATWFIKVPAGNLDGYANLGDAVIFMCALTMGGLPAFIAGGVGSCLADLLSGYAIWAPWTLIIKGFEGLLAGIFCRIIATRVTKKGLAITLQITVLVLAAIWMVFGYFMARWLIISGAVGPALIEIPFNLAQGAISVAISSVLVFTKGLSPKQRFF